MYDIFISYSRKDIKFVKILANTLEANGYSVWWDTRILPGQDFEKKIQETINQSKCVVVVWSKNSIESSWVKDESSEGLRRNILIPISHKNVTPPFSFRGTHTIDLTGWKGNTSDARFKKLNLSIQQYSLPKSVEITITKTKTKTKTKKYTFVFISLLMIMMFYYLSKYLINNKINSHNLNSNNVTKSEDAYNTDLFYTNIYMKYDCENAHSVEYVDLKVGQAYTFWNKYIAKEYKVGIDDTRIVFGEKYDYNGGENPGVEWTTNSREKKNTLKPYTSLVYAKINKPYEVKFKPPEYAFSRKDADIALIWFTKIYQKSLDNNTKWDEDNPFEVIDCVFYRIVPPNSKSEYILGGNNGVTPDRGSDNKN